ncbi:hypothetical protein WDW86_20635 [Bdellovibrionota bacterium FG-2]
MGKYSTFIAFFFMMVTGSLSYSAQEKEVQDLPEEMKRLGFQLERVNSGTYLIVPSGALWNLSPDLKSASGLLKKGRFTDLRYQRAGDRVNLELKANNKKRVSVELSLSDLSVRLREYQDKIMIGQTVEQADPKLVETYKIWRMGASPEQLDYVLAEYDSKTKTLKIVERTSGKLIRSVALQVPQGVRINIIDGRFLLATQIAGNKFSVKDKFVGSGEGSQMLFDLTNHLQRNSSDIEFCSWGVFEPDFVQSATMSSIQDVLDRFISSGDRDETLQATHPKH